MVSTQNATYKLFLRNLELVCITNFPPVMSRNRGLTIKINLWEKTWDRWKQVKDKSNN